jgi:hypothetical protein
VRDSNHIPSYICLLQWRQEDKCSCCSCREEPCKTKVLQPLLLTLLDGALTCPIFEQLGGLRRVAARLAEWKGQEVYDAARKRKRQVSSTAATPHYCTTTINAVPIDQDKTLQHQQCWQQ